MNDQCKWHSVVKCHVVAQHISANEKHTQKNLNLKLSELTILSVYM